MYDEKDLMILYALTSTHAGSGDHLNYIDLPIQREKHTSLPKIEASSLKGSIKQAMEQNTDESPELKDLVFELLGNEGDGETASAISFSDVRLLFFPVKSAKGIFAYVTCPFVLKRFISDCAIIGIKNLKGIDGEEASWLSCQKNYIASTVEKSSIAYAKQKKVVVLDEYVFEVEQNTGFHTFMTGIKENLPPNKVLINDFLSRVILINDDDFTYFANHSTEVTTRIKIGKNGTVEEGALFTQENIPPETIFYSLVFFTKSKKNESMNAQEARNKFNEIFKNEIFQIGGDMTLGKGLFYKKMWLGGEKK